MSLVGLQNQRSNDAKKSLEARFVNLENVNDKKILSQKVKQRLERLALPEGRMAQF